MGLPQAVLDELYGAFRPLNSAAWGSTQATHGHCVVKTRNCRGSLRRAW